MRITSGSMIELKLTARHASQTQHQTPSSHPKMQFKMMNGAEYEAGRRRRGSITMWPHIGGHRRLGRRTAHDSGRSGDLFRQRDSVLSDASHGVQAGAASSRRLDDFRRRVAGLRSGRARPHDRQPPSDQTAVDRQAGATRRPAAPSDRQHRLEGLRRRSVAGWPTNTPGERRGSSASCTWRWMPTAARWVATRGLSARG
jgi:hypothetical protein